MLKRSFCLLCAFLVSLLVFLSTYYSSASAAGTGTRTLTVAETRALIGDTIHAKYFNGTDYIDFDFVYNSSNWMISQVQCESSDALPTVGDALLLYTHSGSFNVSTNNSYIQVDLYPEYSFFDTTLISQYVGVSSGGSVSSAAYSPPAWRWYTSFAGDKFFYNDWMSSANSGVYSFFTMGFDSSMPFDFVQINEFSQSTFSAYSYRVLFYGNSAKNGHLYLAVSCPTISDDSTMQSGTAAITTGTGSGGSGDVNVTVDVDMSETNGLLGTIANLISGLVDGIVSIFIPDEEFLLQWLDDMHDMLREHFGSFIDAMVIIDDVFDAVHGDSATGDGAGMSNVSVTSATIGLPKDITVPFYGGTSFTLYASEWQMPLVPDGFSGILGLFIDFQRIIYLILFINMINDKLHHYLSPQDGT